MYISPQVSRININCFFKNKEKIFNKKLTHNENYNKITPTRKLSSRNSEKIIDTKKNYHKKIISTNTSINLLNQISNNDNSYINANNINQSQNILCYNYINSPQSSRHNKKSSTNIFLNSNNINNAKYIQNYQKANINYNCNCNIISKEKNNCNCSYKNNKNKITKKEINNINYNNGKNIIIKNLLGSESTKANGINPNKINKVFSFPVSKKNNNNVKNKNYHNREEENNKINNVKINNRKVKSYISTTGTSPESIHFSSNSSSKILHTNNNANNKITSYNNFINLNKNYTNINFYSNNENEEIIKNNKKNMNYNIININTSNSNTRNEAYLKTSNNIKNKINSSKLMISGDNNNKNNRNNFILINNLLLNDSNIIDKNKDYDGSYLLRKNIKINYNNYKANTTRNSTDLKHNPHNRKISYSSYDLKNIAKKINERNKTNINEEEKKKKTLYRINNDKSNYYHYYYDNNKNILKNLSPEENHFKIITFLQKVNSNIFSIK